MSEKQKVKIPLKELRMTDEQALGFIKKMRSIGNHLFLVTNGEDQAYVVSDVEDLPLFKSQVDEIISPIEQSIVNHQTQIDKIFGIIEKFKEHMNRFQAPLKVDPSLETNTEPKTEEEPKILGKVIPVVSKEKVVSISKHPETELKQFHCDNCGVVPIPIPKGLIELHEVKCPECGGIIFAKKKQTAKKKSHRKVYLAIGSFVLVIVVLATVAKFILHF